MTNDTYYTSDNMCFKCTKCNSVPYNDFCICKSVAVEYKGNSLYIIYTDDIELVTPIFCTKSNNRITYTDYESSYTLPYTKELELVDDTRYNIDNV
jgi:hypothetical protein